MQLRNASVAQLANASDGRKRFALDCSIAPTQMSADGQSWQDIVPLLVKQGNKWVSQGTPYIIEFDSQCARRVYPDRSDSGKYINLPTNVLWRNLTKTWQSSRVIASSATYDFIFELRNSRIAFKVVIRQAPPFSQISLDVDSVGFDIASLLLAGSGLGIPRPKLVDAVGAVRNLSWSFAGGQLTLGFDLTGLIYPVTLQNTTIDVSIAIGADDGHSRSSGLFDPTDTKDYVGNTFGTTMDAWARFTGISGLSGATIDVAYMTIVAAVNTSGSPLTKILADDQANPAAPISRADHVGRTRTTAGVDWDASFVEGTPYNSPSIVAVIQELANSYDPGVIQILWDDRATPSGNNYNNKASYEHATYNPAALHIEYTAGGAGAANLYAGGFANANRFDRRGFN